MSDKSKIKLTAARAIAEDLIEKMTPLCERCEIAGSIRRQKTEVGDIEIVAVPRWITVPDPNDLFGEPTRMNQLWMMMSLKVDVVWIKPGTTELVRWQIKPDGRYWRGLLKDDVKLDLFLAAPENFGIIYTIRTGSAEFSQALVTHARRIGMPCLGGFLTRGGERIPTPDERDVFDVLGLEYVEPRNRVGTTSLRASRRHASSQT